MIKYFSYGLNTHSLGMSLRCPEAVSLGSAVLEDHEFRFAHHADVVPCAGHQVLGVLWDITRNNLRALDLLEGYPYYYDRRVVEVMHNGELVRALVYYMQPGAGPALPAESYYDVLVEGYQEHGVSTDQLTRALDALPQHKTTDLLFG